MHKQRRLALSDEAALEALWERFPTRSRSELVSLYARLMARAARADALARRKESDDDTIES
jgi:hypothetical protein